MSHNIGRYAGSFLDPFFDNLFEDVNSENFGALSMKTDIKENQDKYTLEVELPGFDKNNISLNLKDGYLTVTAKVNRSIKHEEGRTIVFVTHDRKLGAQCPSQVMIKDGRIVEGDVFGESYSAFNSMKNKKVVLAYPFSDFALHNMQISDNISSSTIDVYLVGIPIERNKIDLTEMGIEKLMMF